MSAARLDRSLGSATQRQARSRSGWRMGQAGVVLAWKADAGGSSVLPHAPIDLGPGRKNGVVLFPSRDGSLVAPHHKAGHRFAVRARERVAPERALTLPQRQRPEG